MKIKELKELIKNYDDDKDIIISVDISTSEDDADKRLFIHDILEVVDIKNSNYVSILTLVDLKRI